jgi:PAS domain S-box-containing protein
MNRARVGAVRRTLLGAMLAAVLLSSCELDPAEGKVALTPAERQWLDQHRDELVVAPDPHYAPFEFFDDKGKATRGLAHEYLELVEQKLGVEFKEKQLSTFAEILEAAKRREVAIVNAATKTPERSEYLLFTAPFIEIKNVIIVRKSETADMTIKQLAGKRISVVRGYAIAEHLAKKYPALRFDPVDNDLRALLDVSYSLSDAAVLDIASVSYLVDREGISNLRVAGDARFPIQLALGSRRDLPELNGILNKALAAVSPQERAGIYRRWITLDDDSILRNESFQIAVAIVLAILLASVGGVLLWNKQLQAEVARRTAQLKRTMEKLSQSERQFRVLVEHAPEAIVVYDMDAERFVDANANATRLFECDLEVLLASGPTRFYPKAPPDGVPPEASLRQHIERAFAGEDVVFERAIRTLRGAEVCCELRLVALPSGNRRLIRASMIDITERKRFETENANLKARLDQVQRLEAIGTLAGGIAHDFNNILQAITGYTEMALMSSRGNAELCSQLEQVKNGASRAADLVRQILSFSKQTKADRRPVQMKSIVGETLKFLRATLPATISIRTSLTTNGLVLADPGQIHQVVMNLCTNAGLAMHEKGGVLEVDLAEAELDATAAAAHPPLAPGRYAKLTVRDTGSGMTPEVLGRVFEPFFSTRLKGQGTGLGLSVVHGIVHGSGGAVSVLSAVDKGTTFEVFLPLIENGLPASLEGESPAQPGTERILFVDDEAPLVALGRLALERLGYRVAPFSDSARALEAFRSAPGDYDVVITDVTMPGMAGDALARELKRLRADLPIILTTGFRERLTKELLDEIGVAEVALKPWSTSELTRLIRKVVRGSNPAL